MAELQPVINAEDVAVTLAVRQDLGPGHDPAVIAEFLDRVGTSIDERVDARLTSSTSPGRHHSRSGPSLGFFSLIFGIPITAIAGDHGVAGIALAWAGIAVVNVADSLRR